MAEKDEINKFKKLIEAHGSKKAAEIMKESGVSYDEDFTEAHKTDPIFSKIISDENLKPSEKIVEVRPLHREIILANNVYSLRRYVKIDINSTLSSEDREKIADNTEYAETAMTYTIS